MLTAQTAAKYRQIQITTTSPGKLLVLLYDGLFKFVGEARAAMSAGHRAIAGTKIGRAHAILEELLVGLAREVAPELCQRLGLLYEFAMSRLLEANIHQSTEKLDDVLRVLAPVRDAFKTAVETSG